MPRSFRQPGSAPHARPVRVLTLLAGLLFPSASPLHAASTISEFVDPNPAVANQFGVIVVPLVTGNVVVTSPSDDANGTNAGAVYVFNGTTGALISSLRGATPGDQVGSGGVIALPNGNFVVLSPQWHSGASTNVGAVTFGFGSTGVNGVVSSTNSLVGSSTGDNVGGGGVTVLASGNYVVRSPNWVNGAATNAGAVTWGSGAFGVTGVVSASNSLVGSTTGDQVGTVTALTNGHYVVASIAWDNGAVANVGAVTWCNGGTGTDGAVSAANSLIGTTASDQIGSTIRALTNGNFVAGSPLWDNGATANVGAVSFCLGSSVVTGTVSAANSLVGSSALDQIGNGSLLALPNGNYLVLSPVWRNGAVVSAGAATLGSGTSGITGAISAGNSLVGTTTNDQVGSGGALLLTNGNYVVLSSSWNNVGAATWGNGSTGVIGAVSSANSLVGTTAGDGVGNFGVALTNGNYVVRSHQWNNTSPAVVDAGAITWCNGTTGRSGAVSSANSLVGSTASDFVGSGGVIALPNGNYVTFDSSWHNGAAASAGAVTWGNGAVGTVGTVSAANSLVGTLANDNVGSNAVALTNGNYVALSPNWDNGAAVNAGAATWCDGAGGTTVGVVSVANSLVGSKTSDLVGNSCVVLTNGNYVLRANNWDNGPTTDVGAITWGNGAIPTTGAVSPANSLIGAVTGDLGSTGITPLSNGNYVVLAPNCDVGSTVNAGAVVFGNGSTGTTGVASAITSMVGTNANTGLSTFAPEDTVDEIFIARFTSEAAGGRVRIGSTVSETPLVTSIADVRNDQGGQLRLKFSKSGSDFTRRANPVTGYQVYRREAISGSAVRRSPVATSAVPKDLAIAGWDYVTTVPATTDDAYQVVVPTLADSNASGFHRAVLFVRAATSQPGVFFDSPVDSGWSADNLPPAPPAPFVAAYSGGGTHLHWGANPEHDFWYYALYRGSSAGFTPAPSNRIATASDTGYVDLGAAGSFYKLSAIDVNGNESAFALVTPGATTAVEGLDAPSFALDGARPNPAVGRNLRIAFALPAGAPARLELLDVSGRRVAVRDVGSLGAGRHVVDLGEKRAFAAGLYWVRLTQGINHRSVRVSVIE